MRKEFEFKFEFTEKDILDFKNTIEDEAVDYLNSTSNPDWSKVDINISVNNNHITVPGNVDTYEMLAHFLLDCKEVLVDVKEETIEEKILHSLETYKLTNSEVLTEEQNKELNEQIEYMKNQIKKASEN